MKLHLNRSRLFAHGLAIVSILNVLALQLAGSSTASSLPNVSLTITRIQ